MWMLHPQGQVSCTMSEQQHYTAGSLGKLALKCPLLLQVILPRHMRLIQGRHFSVSWCIPGCGLVGSTFFAYFFSIFRNPAMFRLT